MLVDRVGHADDATPLLAAETHSRKEEAQLVRHASDTCKAV